MLETDLPTLIRAVAEGDRLAFRKLYDATAPKLLGIALRIRRDRAGAEEILQDVFLRVWQNASRYSPEAGSPMAWMATITRNRAIDVIRQRNAEPITPPPAQDDETWLENLADLSGAESDRADVEGLRQCLARIKDEQRNCILLAYCEGYSREELAARFGRNVNTIKTWLHRGLSELRICLDPPCP